MSKYRTEQANAINQQILSLIIKLSSEISSLSYNFLILTPILIKSTQSVKKYLFYYFILQNFKNNNQTKMISTPQSQTLSTNSSFTLIWHYWFKKYIQHKNKKTLPILELSTIKYKYKIQAIDAHNQQNIKQKIQEIKEKLKYSSPSNLQSSFSTNTNSTNSLTNPQPFYIINPQLQAKEIQQILMQENDDSGDKQDSKQMINQLYSYYLNSKTVFIIYKQEKDNSMQETVSKLINSSYHEGSLRTSKLNLSCLLNQDDSLGDRNDSMLESYDKMEDKIDNLELVSKFADVDGLQIWNAKYYSIPHCYVKVKKNCWARSLSQSVSNSSNPSIFHPCQPKALSFLPIIPKITKYRPSIDKLQPFVTYMQILWSRSPNLTPTCQSIFQYNGLPYIFTQDFKQQSISVLCFYIVYGNQQYNISQKFVQRWMENNPNTTLCKTIKYMKQVVRNKNIQPKEMALKGLFEQNDLIW